LALKSQTPPGSASLHLDLRFDVVFALSWICRDNVLS
jgi:hypothetical protein